MDCQEVLIQVFTYMDDEIEITERIELTRHFEGCTPCAQVLAYEIRVREVVSSRCCEAAPDDMRLRIIEALGLSDAQ